MEFAVAEAIILIWVAGCVALIPRVRQMIESVGDWLAGANMPRSELRAFTVLCALTMAVTVIVGLTWPI